jgi:hypothetical protein
MIMLSASESWVIHLGVLFGIIFSLKSLLKEDDPAQDEQAVKGQPYLSLKIFGCYSPGIFLF